jgi:hypothetical protein
MVKVPASMLTIINSSGEKSINVVLVAWFHAIPQYLYIVHMNEVENYMFLIVAAVIAFFYFITRAAH